MASKFSKLSVESLESRTMMSATAVTLSSSVLAAAVKPVGPQVPVHSSTPVSGSLIAHAATPASVSKPASSTAPVDTHATTVAGSSKATQSSLQKSYQAAIAEVMHTSGLPGVLKAVKETVIDIASHLPVTQSGTTVTLSTVQTASGTVEMAADDGHMAPAGTNVQGLVTKNFGKIVLPPPPAAPGYHYVMGPNGNYILKKDDRAPGLAGLFDSSSDRKFIADNPWAKYTMLGVMAGAGLVTGAGEVAVSGVAAEATGGVLSGSNFIFQASEDGMAQSGTVFTKFLFGKPAPWKPF
jgi:hypothetical protein